MADRGEGDRQRTERALAALAGLAMFGCLCNPSPPAPPPPDTCNNTETGQVSQVLIAAPRIAGDSYGTGAAKEDQPPRVVADNDVMWLVQGGQGASMVPVRLIYVGASPPSCVAQDTQARAGDVQLARNRDNVATYPFDAGMRVTKTIWLPGAFDGQGGTTLTVDTVGLKPSVTVRTLSTYQCPSTGQCACGHAVQTSGDTTGLTDAGLALWGALKACRDATCDGGNSCCDAEEQACRDDLY